MHRYSILLSGWALTLLVSAHVAGAARDDRSAPLFDDLGDHRSPITTAVPAAQQYFDQGLILSYGFNHAEAVRSFREAQRLDPECALCYWGEAYALGPNINKPMDPADAPAAYAALRKALAHAGRASARERAWIAALAARYADPAPADRSALDLAYAESMGAVARAYPDDLDAATLYAEALMDTMPWSYYTGDGDAKPATEEVVKVLESVLARNPQHPGANHFYIHAVEASPSPERAEAAADRLRDLVPGAGHLVHMPAHIYLRIGRYHDATKANERAARADESYLAQCRAQGFYPALYYPHNVHFLWYTASLEGRSKVAIEAARKLAANVPVDLIGDIPLVEQFLVVPWYGLIRFGRYEEVLSEPAPRADHVFATAMWHAARGIAFAARNARREALAERDAYRRGAGHYGADAYEKYGFPADKLLAIAGHLLEAGISRLDRDVRATLSEFEAAVALEDALPYMEPPYWFFPNRQLLGTELLALGRFAEAEAVFRADLAKVPNNGWSLDGLARSLEAQDRDEEAAAVRVRLADAWPHADIALGAYQR